MKNKKSKHYILRVCYSCDGYEFLENAVISTDESIEVAATEYLKSMYDDSKPINRTTHHMYETWSGNGGTVWYHVDKCTEINKNHADMIKKYI